MSQVVDSASPEGKGLEALPSLRPLYLLPDDPLVEEVLIPAFANATSVDTMVGFFSSHVLKALAPGLATFINCSDGQFRLLVSPVVNEEDREALEGAVRSTEEVVVDCVEKILFTEDQIEQHTLKCLAWLIKSRRLEIKVALMQKALFHPKVWLFRGPQGETLSVHGSSNLTLAGLEKNIEQVALSSSWGSSDQRYSTNRLIQQFSTLWKDEDDNCIVVDLPQAVEQNLLQTFQSTEPPTEAQLYSLYKRASKGQKELRQAFDLKPERFQIPSHLQYRSGPFAHQGEAVDAWSAAGYSGVLEMATGSGKTITSMICAYRLYEVNKPLLIVVAAPYIPLVEQWCDEIREFGISPVNVTQAAGPQGRAGELGKLRRRIRAGKTDVGVVVVSHSTLSSKDFQSEVEQFNCTSLLIADEAHNLGSEGFMKDPPNCFEHKLGLSATPVRQYDEMGTESLFGYLGPVVYSYPLEQAIGNCLVEYDYYVHPVALSTIEMDQWHELTARIRQNSWRQDNGQPDEYLTKLFRDRRIVLETATGKIDTLRECLRLEGKHGLQHTLIYASDKSPNQLQSVNTLLNEQGLLFHQVTYEETAHREETR